MVDKTLYSDSEQIAYRC